jgi:serine/threonine-protein kinase RsbW
MIKIDTTIPGTLAGIRQISGVVDQLAAGHRLSSDVVADIQVALDEVLNNIITHGYSDDRVHEIRVRFSLDPQVLTVEIEDDGKPFNPLSVPAPDRSVSSRERKVGGVGIHFVKHLMSDLAYSFENNRNCLVLKKNLVNRQEGGGDESA